MTGHPLPPGANTAEAAYGAGLLDAVVDPSDLTATLARALVALTFEEPAPVTTPLPSPPEARDDWEQVVASRTASRPTGAQLLDEIVAGSVPLHGADRTVAAGVGSVLGRRVVGVALAADRASMPTPAGFALLGRAAPAAAGMAQHELLVQKAAALVIPIQHTIKLEPLP